MVLKLSKNFFRADEEWLDIREKHICEYGHLEKELSKIDKKLINSFGGY